MALPSSTDVRVQEDIGQQGVEALTISTHVRIRFWIEAGSALVAVILFTLTLMAPDWIEVLLGSAPDAGDGSLESMILGTFVLTATVLTVFAHMEWRRPRLRQTARFHSS
jgi:hypothetical protein